MITSLTLIGFGLGYGMSVCRKTPVPWKVFINGARYVANGRRGGYIISLWLI